VARLEAVEVHLVGADELATRAPDRLRFALDDGEQPPVRGLAPQPAPVAQEVLEAALVGVVRVVNAERVRSRDTEELVGVTMHDVEQQRLGRRRRAQLGHLPGVLVGRRYRHSRLPARERCRPH